jgi:hypothetical protein
MKAGDGIRKKGGKWTARYTDAHGRRREVVLEAASRVEARKKRAELVTQVKSAELGLGTERPGMLAAEAWKLYRPIAERRANWRNIEMQWRVHLEPAFGAMKLRHISKAEVRAFLAEKEKSGLAPRTCDHLRIRLGAIFTFAFKEGIYRGENVAHAVGALEVPETDPRVLPLSSWVPSLTRCPRSGAPSLPWPSTRAFEAVSCAPCVPSPSPPTGASCACPARAPERRRRRSARAASPSPGPATPT